MPPRNDGFDWLTYESVFNKSQFRKHNKGFEVGLYAIPRKDVTVFFRNDLDAQVVEKLSDAFFPDAEPQAHLKESGAPWPWKDPGGTVVSAPVTPVNTSLPANRTANKIHDDSYVVLPYNHYDNDLSSKALGTKLDTYELERLQSPYKWTLWKTASRSCVMRTKRVKPRDDPDWDKYFARPWQPWPFAEGNAYRPLQLADGPEASRYQLANRQPADFSVKTGVIFVGAENQKKAEKDCLDSNWIIACLRSDYVNEVDKERKAKGGFDPRLDPDIVILTELLSINEVTERDKGKKDGVQVRDLSPLRTDRLYMAPLNIPFVDLNFDLFNEEFYRLSQKDKAWTDFWKRAWAQRLGRAKALFLLRYGLQHINPNPQNYLIEFKSGQAGKPKPTGRIVIRDLQDAALHREVVWALYGEKGAPPDQAQPLDTLAQLKLPVLKYEFAQEQIKEGICQETGTTNPQFGPPGTQLLWQRFSAFTNASRIRNNPVFQPFWQELMAVMAEWGKAHNREYVRCVESQLGVNFAIDWDSMLDPDSHRQLGPNDYPQYEGFAYQFSKGRRGTQTSGPTIADCLAGSWESIVISQALNEAERAKLEDLKRQEATYESNKKTVQGSRDNVQAIEQALSETPAKLAAKKREVTQLEADILAFEANPSTKLADKSKHSRNKQLLPLRKEEAAELESELATNDSKLTKAKADLIKTEQQISDFESQKGEYEQLKKKVSDFSQQQGFDELKGKGFVVVTGSNFQKGASVRFGIEDAEKVIWGSAEQLYVRPKREETINEVTKCSIPVTVTNPPPGGESVSLTSAPATDLTWEEVASSVVHDYLKSDEGQDAIRAYRDRKWQPARQLFRLRLLDENDSAIEGGAIRIILKNSDVAWTDITDSQGEVHVYPVVSTAANGKAHGTSPEDYNVLIKGYDMLPGSFGLEQVTRAAGKSLDFGFVKIAVLQ